MMCWYRMKTGEPVTTYCKRHGYTSTVVIKRIKKGMTPEQAVEDYIPWRGRKDGSAKYFYKGQVLRKYFGDFNHYQMALKRIKNGMSIEQAVAEVETFYKQKAQRCAGAQKRPVRR